jgi:hypothetical protein
MQKRFDYGKYSTPELVELVGSARPDARVVERARRLLDQAEAHAKERGLEREMALGAVLRDYALAAAVTNNGNRLAASLGVFPQSARVRLLALALS